MRPGGVGGRSEGPAAQLWPGSRGEREIQHRMGSTQRAERFYQEQVLDHLNARMQEFVQRQEMFFLATADAGGACDSSFRAGPPGFLQVLDERTVAYPEYRGNGVHASLGNIRENPQLGLLLMDFLQARIGLHLNGRAELVEDAELRARYTGLPHDPVPGRRALLWVLVTVEEAYIHCAKHIPHLQQAPGGAGRDWGTDDYKRKGGDFFGAARQVAGRRTGAAPGEEPAAHPAAQPAARSAVQPAGEGSAGDSAVWLREAERALEDARRRGAAAERAPFQSWFG